MTWYLLRLDPLLRELRRARKKWIELFLLVEFHSCYEKILKLIVIDLGNAAHVDDSSCYLLVGIGC